MAIPVVNKVSFEEFQVSDNVYKIIHEDNADTYVSLEVSDRYYYVCYNGLGTAGMELLFIPGSNYLLIGVNNNVVALCTKTGRILFSFGLFGYFNGFEDTSEHLFTIYSDYEDIEINKNGFSICKTTPHDPTL
jgi:hypothetical protein